MVPEALCTFTTSIKSALETSRTALLCQRGMPCLVIMHAMLGMQRDYIGSDLQVVSKAAFILS